MNIIKTSRMIRRLFSPFNEFLNTNAKHVIFTCLFYAFWWVIWCTTSQSFELKSFSGRMTGNATLDGFDVTARVSLFYTCFAVFFLIFSMLMVLAYLVNRRSTFLNTTEFRIMNYLSLAGILLFLFNVFGVKTPDSLELIYFGHKLMLAGLILKLIFFRNEKLSISKYAVILILAFSLYFLLADLAGLFGYTKNPDFYIVTFVLAAIFLIILFSSFKRGTNYDNRKAWYRIAYTLVPLASLPAVSVIKDELFFVFRTRGFNVGSQLLPFIVVLMVVAVLVLIRYRRSANKIITAENRLVALGYFPVFVFSLITYAYHSYYIEYSEELYENANNYLPAMELFRFGTVPVIEKLSGHLVSGYFFMILYSILNGLTGLDIILYEFLQVPLALTFLYFLIYYLSRNAYISLFALLFFPYAEVLVSSGFCITVLSILVINKIVLNPPSRKTYIGLFSTLLFLLFWRIDVGITCMVAMPLTLLYHYYSGKIRNINWMLLLKAFFIGSGFSGYFYDYTFSLSGNKFISKAHVYH